jgi:hypothetical protein
MLDEKEYLREVTWPRATHSRGSAWMHTLDGNRDIPQSHWRKEHDENSWRWVALKTCHYWNCETCHPEVKRESI